MIIQFFKVHVSIIRLLLLFLFFSSAKIGWASHRLRVVVPNRDTKQEIDSVIHLVGVLMSNDSYDSASIILNKALGYADTTSYTEGKYYLYAFQSEILYYQSIFNPALNSAYKALTLAEDLENDTLIGSAQNLIGLLLGSLNEFEYAQYYLREAVVHLPFDHGNPYLSYRFHAASNLCEVYIKRGQIDSAEFYANFSLKEATRLNRHRAMSLNYWNLAKVNVLKKDYDAALLATNQGIAIAEKHKINDVVLFFYALQAEVYTAVNNFPQSTSLILKGIKDIEELDDLTMFSKVEFLTEAIHLLTLQQNYALAIKAQVLLNQFVAANEQKRNEEQLAAIERFYETEKKLALSNLEIEKRKTEAKLHQFIYVATIVFIILVVIGILFYSVAYLQKKEMQSKQQQLEKDVQESNRLKQLQEEKMEVANQERNRIAKELHDDVGGTLSSINLYAEMAISHQAKNPKKSVEMMQKASEKSRELAETINDIIWAIYSKNDQFSHLVQRMKNFTFDIAAPKDIVVKFHYPFQLDAIILNAEQRKNIYFIFKEAINNAIKYSECTQIYVQFDWIDNAKLNIKIVDNGKGFDIQATTKNNGFYTMQYRAKRIGGTTIIDSQVDVGTTICVELPL